MRYISTRGQAPVLGFEDTMLTGLARDGGLYVPEALPTLSKGDIAALAGLPYEEVAVRVMAPFVAEAYDETTFGDLVEKAYAGFGHDARAPLVQLGANHYLLELFHGPTLAFKDFAMQLIGQMFQHTLARRGERVTVVGATSGDTGSAAIEAFRGLEAVDVFILYPHGRVSEVQRRQMTTPDEANVHALAISGHFDDAQARVKDMFNDFDFRDRVALAGVNSINFARVLAQVVYYFTAATALGAPHREVSFTVPTGNFGDIFAGHIAKRMGLPINKLVVATNQNDILHRCLTTGEYRTGRAASEAETSAAITDMLSRTGELLCPHTAVGTHVAEAYLGDTPMVTLATAHPAKFPDAVEAATGIRPPLPPRMADLFDRPERITPVDNDLHAIEAIIEERRA